MAVEKSEGTGEAGLSRPTPRRSSAGTLPATTPRSSFTSCCWRNKAELLPGGHRHHDSRPSDAVGGGHGRCARERRGVGDPLLDRSLRRTTVKTAERASDGDVPALLLSPCQPAQLVKARSDTDTVGTMSDPSLVRPCSRVPPASASDRRSRAPTTVYLFVIALVAVECGVCA